MGLTVIQIQGFQEDGKAAIAASPGYFLAWYSAKSIALVGAVAWVAYLLGTKSCRR